MKLVIFTSNSLRHKYVANTLAQHADETLVVVESKKRDDAPLGENPTLQDEIFAERHETEQQYFAGNEILTPPSIPLLPKEIRSESIYKTVQDFAPDMAIVFGSSIIKEPLLSLIPQGKFINLHLGLSPYYRGSGTNFWPFIHKEIEYVGATLLHIDPGIDTGDIVAHVRPTIEASDTVHSLGCKTILEGTKALAICISMIKEGKTIPRTPQWEVPNEKYYRSQDITEEVLQTYRDNMENGLIETYLKNTPPTLRLIELS